MFWIRLRRWTGWLLHVVPHHLNAAIHHLAHVRHHLHHVSPCCMPGVIDGICGDGTWPCWAYTADAKTIPMAIVAPRESVLSKRVIGWSFPDLREIGLALPPVPGDAYDQDHAA
jgi:hypothetical protein